MVSFVLLLVQVLLSMQCILDFRDGFTAGIEVHEKVTIDMGI